MLSSFQTPYTPNLTLTHFGFNIFTNIENYFANFIMMIAFLIFGYKNNDELEPEQKSLIRMAALYCIAGCLGGISGRMTYYFAVYY